MTEIKTERRIPITEDVKLLCDICRRIGYLSAFVDKDWADVEADQICNYITELFNAKMQMTITTNDLVYRHYPYGTEVTTGTPLPPQGVTVTCKKE